MGGWGRSSCQAVNREPAACNCNARAAGHLGRRVQGRWTMPPHRQLRPARASCQMAWAFERGSAGYYRVPAGLGAHAEPVRSRAADRRPGCSRRLLPPAHQVISEEEAAAARNQSCEQHVPEAKGRGKKQNRKPGLLDYPLNPAATCCPAEGTLEHTICPARTMLLVLCTQWLVQQQRLEPGHRPFLFWCAARVLTGPLRQRRRRRR